MTTIKDIAKQAGVSISTVSAVINGTAYVSPALTKRVHEAIEACNYRPNAVARSLKKKHTKTIGIFLADIVNPYYPPMIRGMEDRGWLNQYNVILCNTGDSHSRFLAYLDLVQEKRVDGLLVANVSSDEDLQLIENTGLTYVLVNRKPSHYANYFVGLNNRWTSVLQVNHLLKLGIQNIAYLSGESSISTARERKDGFLESLKQNSLPLEEEWILEGDYSFESGYHNTQRILKSGKIPEAICAASDMIAFGAITALLDAGISVPNDVAVVGNDNNPFSQHFRVPLTTIDHPIYQMGEMAMDHLIACIQEKQPPQQVILTPTLVIRESCGAINYQSKGGR